MIDSKRGVLRTGEAHSGIPHGMKYPHAKTLAGAWYWHLLGECQGNLSQRWILFVLSTVTIL